MAETSFVTPPSHPQHETASSQVIVRNSAFVMGAQVAMRVVSFLFQVYVVRTLGATDYGKFSTVLAYLGIFAIFSDFGLAPYMVREIARKWEHARALVPNIMAIRVMLSVLVLIVATASAQLLGYPSDIVLGVFIAGCGLFIYAFQGPLDAVLTARERLDVSSLLMMLNQLIFVVLGTFALLSGVGFIGLLIATLVGVGIWGALSGLFAYHRLGLRIERVDTRQWRSLLGAALPFGVSGVAYVLMQRFDAVVLSLNANGPPSLLPGTACSICFPSSAYGLAVSGAQLVGWYAVALNLVLMTLLVAQSVAIAMYPTLVREHECDPAAIRRPLQQAVEYMAITSFPIVMGAFVLADQIIVKLYTAAFMPSIDALRVLVWVLPLLFFSELLGRAADVLRLERAKARRNVLSAGVVLVLDIVLVLTFGLIGAAVAYVANRLVNTLLILNLVGVQRMFSRDTLWTLARVAAAAAAMGVLVHLLHGQNLFLVIGAGVVSYGLALFAFRVLTRAKFARLAGIVTHRAV